MTRHKTTLEIRGKTSSLHVIKKLVIYYKLLTFLIYRAVAFSHWPFTYILTDIHYKRDFPAIWIKRFLHTRIEKSADIKKYINIYNSGS